MGRFLSDSGGNIAVVTALVLPAVVGFAGLGVEVGYHYFEQRRLQTATDLAAYAGAITARTFFEEEESADAAPEIVASAKSEALQHGFDPVRGVVAISWPPATGQNINKRSVEIVIQQQYARAFSALFTSDPVQITTRAVATFDEPRPACVIALHETASAALLLTGNVTTRFTKCDLMSNSLAVDSVSIEGSADVTASCVNSAGGIHNSATLVVNDCPEPRVYTQRAEDPYRDVPAPEKPSGCTSVPGGNGAKSLSPGRYCGNLNLSSDVSFAPGVYYIDGGTLRINGGANVTGTGVTFYLTDGADVAMDGNASINLSAPESGTYKDILFYGDPNSTTTNAKFNGTADSRMIGSLYFPTQSVELLGDFQGSNGCTRVVALYIELRGNLDFEADCTGVDLGPIGVPAMAKLVE